MARWWPGAAGRFAIAAGALLFLPGCFVKGLVESDRGQKSLLSPDIIKVTVPTDPPKPVVKDAVPPPPAPVQQVATAVDDKLLPREIVEPDVGLSRPVPGTAGADGTYTQKKSRFGSDPTVVYSDQVITEDVTWQGDVLVVGTLTVAPQATLTVSPGTRVRFRVSGTGQSVLVVQGRLTTSGTADRPVVFTSDGENGSRRDWQGVVFLGTTKKNNLDNLVVEGAETCIDATYSTISGKNLRLNGCLTGFTALESLISFSGGEVSGCENGMVFVSGEGDLSGMKFSGNGVALRGENSSLFISSSVFSGNRDIALAGAGCTVKISGSAFTSNGRGAVLEGAKGDILGNLFQDNRGSGLQLADPKTRVTGNEFRENGEYGIRVQEGSPVFWGNIFAGNARYDMYNAGRADVKAMMNWWDRPDPRSSIYDHRIDASRGRVLYVPVLPKKPLPPLGRPGEL